MPRGVKGSGPVEQAARPALATPASITSQQAAIDSGRPITNVDDMPEEQLRAYARRVGVSPRDCNELGLDRLRQNTKLFLESYYEDLTA